MSHEETQALLNKIDKGVHLAFERLVKKAKENDGELVVFKNDKVVRIKARELYK
jgi:hypothetical protein